MIWSQFLCSTYPVSAKMAVVCLLNPQRGVFGSPFMNNMTSDLLIRAFNLKCNKEKGSANKQSSQITSFIIIFWKRASHAFNRTRLHMNFCIKINLSVSFIDWIINFSNPPPTFNQLYLFVCCFNTRASTIISSHQRYYWYLAYFIPPANNTT